MARWVVMRSTRPAAGRHAEAARSYRTGDPLNTAKLREAYGAKRAAQINVEVEQDAARSETADAFLDNLDKSELIPQGIKEAVSHAMSYGGVYRTYLERLYYALRAGMKR
jgi:hypothetical protein